MAGGQRCKKEEMRSEYQYCQYRTFCQQEYTVCQPRSHWFTDCVLLYQCICKSLHPSWRSSRLSQPIEPERKAEGDAFNQQVENTQLSKSLSNCESIGFWWYERACSNILFGCFVLPYHNVTPERGQRSHFSLSHRAETIAQSSFLETVHGLNVICLCDIEEIHHMEYLIGSISCWAHLANIPFLIRLQMLSC